MSGLPKPSTGELVAADHPRLVRQYRAALWLAWRALREYGDPDSYYATMILGDRPCGWFVDDVSDAPDSDYDRPMHGAKARETMARINRILSLSNT